MRKFGLATLILASVAAVTVVVPAASAHDGCVQSWYEPSVACGRNWHKTVDVCDRHADGHWVWAQVHLADLSGSGDSYPIIVDESGSQSGCGSKTFRREVDWVVGFQVCVQHEGCGPWRNLGYH